MQERAAGPREVRRIRRACVPPERRRVELERSGARVERGRLVAEHRRREDIEEAVAAVTRGIRVMQPGGRLEHEVAVAATADEAGEVRRRGSARAAAPDFGAEAALGEPVQPAVERVVERHLDVDLALEVDRLARLDGLDARVAW